MELSNLSRSKGFKNKSPRIGRGNASKGNTSGKGHKGQKARSGGSISPFFEGGQTPLVQRMPKYKGFKRPLKLVDTYTIVNLSTLEKDTNISSEVTKEILRDLEYIKVLSDKVKVLGNGDFTKKLTFVGIDKFSKSASNKIIKAGGEIK